jgi:hypothetical protein
MSQTNYEHYTLLKPEAISGGIGFFCIIGHYGGEYLHHVFGPMSARVKPSASTNDPFIVQKCIVQGTFRWLGVTK